MKRKLIYITMSFLWIQCNTNSTELTEETHEENSQITQLNWLIGEWRTNFENGFTAEIWVKDDENNLIGLNYTLFNEDTVAYESILLTEEANEIFYIPTVQDQNQGLPIKFKMIEIAKDKVVFENVDHDFPQRIQYINFNGDSLLAEISGTIEGIQKAISFPMIKYKPEFGTRTL